VNFEWHCVHIFECQIFDDCGVILRGGHVGLRSLHWEMHTSGQLWPKLTVSDQVLIVFLAVKFVHSQTDVRYKI